MVVFFQIRLNLEKYYGNYALIFKTNRLNVCTEMNKNYFISNDFYSFYENQYLIGF